MFEKLVNSIREIESNIESLSIKKKEIDNNMSALRESKDRLRLEIEESMNSSNKNHVLLSDGTEISMRNSPKSFTWEDDSEIIDFLKSIGKFNEICTVETVINKKKAKSLLDTLNDCNALPSFVICEQEKVLQIKGPAQVKNDTKTEKQVKCASNKIEELDTSQLDGI